ncbi:hypothetical protein HYT05_03380 [Candidatus Kaiserbacteria bacterium]|nr:hypothetical protein [Candidatus Kaiserbacteria bacterium]
MSQEIGFQRWSRGHDERNVLKAMIHAILERSLVQRGIQTLYLREQRGDLVYPGHTPDDESEFIIHVHARAGDTRANVMPKTLRGFEVNEIGDRCFFEPSGRGILIIDPDSASAVAELIGNELYVLFPLNEGMRMRTEDRLSIYQFIFEETARLLGEGLPTLEQILSGTFRLPSAKTLRSMQEQLDTSRESLAQKVSHVATLISQLEGLGRRTGDTDVLLEQLHRIPEVQSLSVHDGVLQIGTFTMYGVDVHQENHLHEYGEFNMRMTFGLYGGVQFNNTTRRVPVGGDDYGHPHVDRGRSHFWCQGEGKFIQPLLEKTEIMPAVLFALQAISTINDDPHSNGNYLWVLRKFPIVKERMEYPKDKPPLSDETRRAFADLLDQKRGNGAKNLRSTIAEKREEITVDQGHIVRGALATMLERAVASAKDTSDKEDRIAEEISMMVKDRISAIRDLDEVLWTSVTGDVIEVEVNKLETTGNPSQKKYLSGPFTLTYDLFTGAVRFKNKEPTMLNNGHLYNAPQVPDMDGSLPPGQLTMTLPELLGELELATAVALSLDLLKTIDEDSVPAEVLTAATLSREQELPV